MFTIVHMRDAARKERKTKEREEKSFITQNIKENIHLKCHFSGNASCLRNKSHTIFSFQFRNIFVFFFRFSHYS